MKINTANYFVIDAFKSISRNRTISIAAMITVFITFFILGIFTLLGLNINKVIDDAAGKIEIQVFLEDDIKLVDKREVEIRLNAQDGVKEVIYETKEEAFTKFSESLDNNEGLLQGYSQEKNPLPNSYIVSLSDPTYAAAVAEAVEKMDGVESIKNQLDMVEKIQGFVTGIQISGIAIFVVFIGVSMFLIMNTIKLTVYARRREVGIMKFVGATDWFIRWPFIIEGIVIGTVGAFFASIVIYFGYKAVYTALVSNMMIVSFISPGVVLGALVGLFTLGGFVIGAIAAVFALRKFLVV